MVYFCESWDCPSHTSKNHFLPCCLYGRSYVWKLFTVWGRNLHVGPSTRWQDKSEYTRCRHVYPGYWELKISTQLIHKGPPLSLSWVCVRCRNPPCTPFEPGAQHNTLTYLGSPLKNIVPGRWKKNK